MGHLSFIHAFLSRKRLENKTMVLWDKAEPISIDELRTKFAALACNEFEANGALEVAGEELTFEELWRIFESLEDLDDCAVI